MEYRAYYYGVTNLSLDNVTVIGPSINIPTKVVEEGKDDAKNEDNGEDIKEEEG
jgi:hypothetical protein